MNRKTTMPRDTVDTLPKASAAPSKAGAVRMRAGRRAPVQGRSQDTVQRIFAAASRLLGQGVPLDDISTSAIAREAGVSVGGLYRFFADKQAIVDAIAVHHLEDFRACLARDLAAAPPRDGPGLMNAVIDAFVAFLDAHPDFRTIAYGGRHISAETREVQSAPDTGGSALLKRFMIEGLGFSASPDLDLRLRVAAEVGDRLLGYAYQQPDKADRARLIAEMKRLLSGYLFPASP